MSHVFSVNVCGVICHSADGLQDDCQMSYDFAVFAPAVSRLENVLYLFTLSRYTVSFVVTIVDSLIRTIYCTRESYSGYYARSTRTVSLLETIATTKTDLG